MTSRLEESAPGSAAFSRVVVVVTVNQVHARAAVQALSRGVITQGSIVLVIGRD
ncbi:hypothetical protein [Streptomyces sp. NPDC001292]|uniref:hypothetical protein n=1 Tax=Streptomyces sp. NPDC001292 TaxID=3364558 RepID=UPI00369EFB81